MDKFNLIRASIILVGGLVSIIFHKRLNNFKNRMLKKFNLKKWIRDEGKSYIYTGIFFIIIAIILFVYSITH
jgi:hypothetical protein